MIALQDCAGLYPQIRKAERLLSGKLTCPSVTVNVTRKVHYIRPPKLSLLRRLGNTRTYSKNSYLIEVSSKNKVDEKAVLVHELIHVAGGDEIDAKCIEALVSRTLGWRTLVPNHYRRLVFEKRRGQLLGRIVFDSSGHPTIDGFRLW